MPTPTSGAESQCCHLEAHLSRLRIYAFASIIEEKQHDGYANSEHVQLEQAPAKLTGGIKG